VVVTPYYYRAVINTLIYKAISSSLITVLGYMASYISMRYRGVQALIVEILSIAPLVIPGVAVGIAYYQMFHNIFRGSWLDPVYLPWIYLLVTTESLALQCGDGYGFISFLEF
jgi:ABC-type spermidine/putrescine transport system permease subunit II